MSGLKKNVWLSDVDGVFNSGEVFLDYSLRHYTPRTGDIQFILKELDRILTFAFISSSSNGLDSNTQYMKKYFPKLEFITKLTSLNTNPENRAGLLCQTAINPNIENIIYTDDSILNLTRMRKIIKDFEKKSKYKGKIKLYHVNPESFYALLFDFWKKNVHLCK